MKTNMFSHPPCLIWQPGQWPMCQTMMLYFSLRFVCVRLHGQVSNNKYAVTVNNKLTLALKQGTQISVSCVWPSQPHWPPPYFSHALCHYTSGIILLQNEHLRSDCIVILRSVASLTNVPCVMQNGWEQVAKTQQNMVFFLLKYLKVTESHALVVRKG